jgi:Ca2+-dependent lipid-binding protein
VYYGDNQGDDYLFQSKCKSKTVEPSFNDKFNFALTSEDTEAIKNGGTVELILRVFDDDGMHGEDAMGTVVIPLSSTLHSESSEWYPVGPGSGEFECSNASGDLCVKVSLQV